MPNPFTSLGTAFGGYLPTILAALVVLIIGWIVAIVLSRLVEGLLRKTNLDDRIAGMMRSGTGSGSQPSGLRVSHWISTAVFWIILLFAIVGFLQVLNLAGVSTPLNNILGQIMAFIPALLSAAALLFVAWVIATFLRMVITRVVSASNLTRRMSENAQMRTPDRVTIGETVGNIVYWLVFLLFLPAILGALNLNGILAPVQTMVNEILGMLPNILAAALILAIGYLAARIVRQIVTGLLRGVGVDRIGQRAGITEEAAAPRLSNVLGMVAFVLIMIPVAIAALNALNIPAVSEPAAAMLTTLLNAVPAIFGAVLLVAVAYFVARVVGQFVTSLLSGIGFDHLFGAIGLEQVMPANMAASSIPATGAESYGQARGVMTWTPSRIIGVIVTLAIILFAVIAAANLLGFAILAAMVSDFLGLAGNILLGLFIFGLGLYLSTLADRAIRGSGASQAGILATAARVAILIFSGALALRQMGLGQDIVNLAFGLLFGAVAIAVALAFGLGGRDVAARQLERWRVDMQKQAGNTQFGAIPTTGSRRSDVESSDRPVNRQSGTGHNPASQVGDMDYEGGANQNRMNPDIPDTGGPTGSDFPHHTTGGLEFPDDEPVEGDQI